ncbi:hypothetical protein FANTH_8650 [Fusarium anthophilum]|uniref:Tat pathway signal sequence n=1 Tax=Fusarium anthophilum TaxID=48485 RepID=A0A8H4Z9Q3_9HYPO|nr:hypothetical protein FANTH_8650 [Fusarium anthophilum]
MSQSKVDDSDLVNDALTSEEELFLPKLGHAIQTKKKHGTLYCLFYLCILLIIALVCLSTYLALSLNESSSPVEELVQYKNLVFTTGFGSERTPYQGPPTPERDALWDDLYLNSQNMIRKRLYIEDGKYDPNHKLTGIEHLEHCYDALRQSLMCSADITPLPWVWSDKAQEAKEVARVTHTCRDFDVLRDWAREHAVHHFDKKTQADDGLDDH